MAVSVSPVPLKLTMAALAQENIWFNKAQCDDAERMYFEKLSGAKVIFLFLVLFDHFNTCPTKRPNHICSARMFGPRPIHYFVCLFLVTIFRLTFNSFFVINMPRYTHISFWFGS